MTIEDGTERLSRNVSKESPPILLRNNPEERSYRLLREGALISRIF